MIKNVHNCLKIENECIKIFGINNQNFCLNMKFMSYKGNLYLNDNFCL